MRFVLVIAELHDRLTLKFESVLHGNDPRMAASLRVYSLDGSELRYVVSMATQKTPDLTVHLTALLQLQRREMRW